MVLKLMLNKILKNKFSTNIKNLPICYKVNFCFRGWVENTLSKCKIYEPNSKVLCIDINQLISFHAGNYKSLSEIRKHLAKYNLRISSKNLKKFLLSIGGKEKRPLINNKRIRVYNNIDFFDPSNLAYALKEKYS